MLPFIGIGQEVPFRVIDEVPIYPGCERGSNAEKRKCMSENIAQFVSRKFNKDNVEDLGLSGKQGIKVLFKIDKNGNVVDVRASGPHPILEKEAVRVVKMLPKMKPGRIEGKPVIVSYALPLSFVVQGSNTESPYNSTITPPPPPPPPNSSIEEQASLIYEYVIFTDNQKSKISQLNEQLIDIIGESNLLLSKSTIEQFMICFFGKIASNSSYKTYQEDLIKAEKYSEDKDERTYFLFSLDYINSALLSCMDENPKFLEEYSKVDKIIPQSDVKIKYFAEIHLEDLKKEMGIFQFIELGKTINWENYSLCFVRKMWDTFTPKEMYNLSPLNEKIKEELMEICMSENLKIPTLEKKYGSDYTSDDNVLGEYISFINNPKSKGLDFKIKSPKGFVNTFANSPNIIRLWRKENTKENDDPWIFILVIKGENYDNKIEFEKALIDDGGIFMYAEQEQFKNSSNASYFSAEDYPGMIIDYEDANGQKFTTINLWLPNHLLQFFFAERKSDNYDYYREILITFAKSIKFL